jgi:dolichol kinase
MALVVCNRGLDDNLTIPIFSGIMMSLAALL